MVDESKTPSLALADEDWVWATWRKPKPSAPLPPPAPFDRDAILARLATKVRAVHYGHAFDFSRAELSPSMSKDEARIWFESMCSVDKAVPPKAKADQLKKKKLAPLTVDAATKALAKGGREPDERVTLVLCALFDAMTVTELLLTAKPATGGYDGGGSFFLGWHEHVLPRLASDERASLKKRIAPKITAANFPTDFYDEPPGEFFVAASLGLHDELLAVVSSWPDDRYSSGEDWCDAYHVPQLMILGLGSGELVSQHMRRLQLRLRQDHFMRGFLAHTEYSALDWAANTIVLAKNKDEAASLAKVLALVHAPENAVAMLEVATRSKAALVAAEWLDENVGCAAAGLVEVAAGRGALAEAATERLRVLKRAGYTHLIEGAAKGASADAAKKATAVLEAKEENPRADVVAAEVARGRDEESEGGEASRVARSRAALRARRRRQDADARSNHRAHVRAHRVAG